MPFETTPGADIIQSVNYARTPEEMDKAYAAETAQMPAEDYPTRRGQMKLAAAVQEKLISARQVWPSKTPAAQNA